MTRDEQQLLIIQLLGADERLETIDEVAERLGVPIEDMTVPYIEENNILLQPVKVST